MPETSRVLCLHSPAGSDVTLYKWPLHVSESWNEPHEIVETIRWVCNDFPDLRLAVENYVLNNFDPSSFENMKLLCEKYNRAVDNIRKLWSGRQPPPCIDAPPSLLLLKHILTQVYNRAIIKPEDLNNYEPFSPEVYGETSFELISSVISSTRLTENDVFLDLGSGVGQVVLQVASLVGCKCYGIEKAEIPAKYSEEMDRQFVKWMDFYGKSYGDYELLKGDFLDPKFDDIFNSATVIFCNNFAFGPALNHQLKMKFQNLRDGVKIISSREFCPLNFRLTERNLSDIGAMMRVAELSPLKGSVSWTGKPVSYYLHRIDRTKMEEFFHKQKHPEDKSEGSSSLDSGESSSSTTESSSEDSSLDSSDDEDLFRRPSEEIHHFPPSESNPFPSLYQSTVAPEPHPLNYHKKPFLNNITSSAIQKKATPPSGPTNLPRPHPQSFPLGDKPFRKSYRSRTIPSSQRGMNNRRGIPSKTSIASAFRGKRNKSFSSMTSLFDCFQGQIQEYIDQLDDPSFVTWLTDAVEKEKMKKEHLRAVIVHLESEVSSLSGDTINNMKESMISLGISNLTPEGLLIGAKDIVSLNRQLRREVQMLEREVTQLQEQNDMISCLCKEAKLSLPEDLEDTVKNSNLDNDKSISQLVLSTTPSSSSSSHTLPHPLVNGSPTTPPMITTPPPRSVKEKISSNIKNEDILHTSLKDIDLSNTTCLTIDKEFTATSGLSEFREFNKYEIRLETIDQAVLELGPFAKDAIVKERTDISVDLPSTHPDTQLKKERKKSYSPCTNASRSLRRSRISNEDSSPIASLSPVKDNPPKSTSQRKAGKKRAQKDVSIESPVWTGGESVSNLISTSLDSLNFPSPTGDSTHSNEVSCDQHPVQSSTPESTVVEAMLTLSTSLPVTSSNTELHISTPSKSSELRVTQECDDVTMMSSYSDSDQGIINEAVHQGQSETSSNEIQPQILSSPQSKLISPYPLPMLNKLSDPTVMNRKRRTSSASSHRSSNIVDESHTSYSPNPHTQSGVTSPSSYMYIDKGTHLVNVQPSPLSMTTKATEDSKIANPFWPVPSFTQPSTSEAVTPSGFTYPLTLGGWNAANTFRPTYFPALSSYPRTTVESSPLDLANPSFRPMMTPLFLYPTHYQFPTGGLTTPLTNQHLITSTSNPNFQASPISSPAPSQLSAFKTLQSQFNHSLTPPTLHPLATAQDGMKPPSANIDNTLTPNPWMTTAILGGSQFPNPLLNSTQFTGLGTSPLSSLNPYTTLQNAAGTLDHISNTRLGSQSRKNRISDTIPNEMTTPTVIYPTVRGEPLDEMKWRRQYPVSSSETYGISLQSAQPPNMVMMDGSHSTAHVYGIPRKSSYNTNEVAVVKPSKPSSDKMKLKIHQINREDFKTGDKRKRGRRPDIDLREHNTFTSYPVSHKTSPSPNEIINVVDTDIPEESTHIEEHSVLSLNPVENKIITSLSTIPSTSTPVTTSTLTIKPVEPVIPPDEPNIQDDDDVSSEGTVSVSPSPNSPHPELVTNKTNILPKTSDDIPPQGNPDITANTSQKSPKGELMESIITSNDSAILPDNEEQNETIPPVDSTPITNISSTQPFGTSDIKDQITDDVNKIKSINNNETSTTTTTTAISTSQVTTHVTSHETPLPLGTKCDEFSNITTSASDCTAIDMTTSHVTTSHMTTTTTTEQPVGYSDKLSSLSRTDLSPDDVQTSICDVLGDDFESPPSVKRLKVDVVHEESHEAEKKKVNVDDETQCIVDIGKSLMEYDEFNSEKLTNNLDNRKIKEKDTTPSLVLPSWDDFKERLERSSDKETPFEHLHEEDVPQLSTTNELSKTKHDKRLSKPSRGDEERVRPKSHSSKQDGRLGPKVAKHLATNAGIKTHHRQDTTRQSEKQPFYKSSDKISVSRKPHSLDHRQRVHDDVILSNKLTKNDIKHSKKEDRRSLTPGRQTLRPSPTPSNSSRGKYPNSGDESPPSYSTHYDHKGTHQKDLSNRKKHPFYSSNPDGHTLHHSSSKRPPSHTHRPAKNEEWSYEETTHGRQQCSHSLTPVDDRSSHEGKNIVHHYNRGNDESYWNHSFKGRSHDKLSIDEDTRQSRKRSDNNDDQIPDGKRHKLKRPKQINRHHPSTKHS